MSRVEGRGGAGP